MLPYCPALLSLFSVVVFLLLTLGKIYDDDDDDDDTNILLNAVSNCSGMASE